MTVEFISARNASTDVRGASTALLGSPQTIADSSLDHVGRGGKRRAGDTDSPAG